VCHHALVGDGSMGGIEGFKLGKNDCLEMNQ
jgi:hypothetical protein